MLALSLDMGRTHIGHGVSETNELLGSTSLDSEPAGFARIDFAGRHDGASALLKESGATAELCEGIANGPQE